MQLTKDDIIRNRLHEKNILLMEQPTRSIKAVALLVDNQPVVAVDPYKFETKCEETIALYHEYHHIDQRALYDFTSSLQTRKRREYKANKAMVQELVPINSLKEQLECGCATKWSLAEVFGVTEDVIALAFTIYKQMELI